MRDPLRGQGAEAGFTLVEMLVSLALLALAAVLVGQGLIVDRAFLARSERRLSEGERVGAAQDLIRVRLEHLSGQTRVEGRTSFVDVAGAPDQLSFTASAAGQETQRLFVTPAGQLRLEGPAAPGAEPGPLLTGVRRLEISYWGAPAGETKPAWRLAWSRQPQPPELVRVRVVFEDGARRWPDLIVRPAVTVGSACSFDPVLGACRRRA